MTLLSNRQLQLERIPDPDGDLADWGAFAHSGGSAEMSPQVRELLHRIRAKVAAGELD